MTDSPVNFSTGLPETVLAPVDAHLTQELEAAIQQGAGAKAALAEVLKKDPTYLDAWARISEVAADDIEGYTYARIGYHRGLDALRKSGWRGTGYVRWRDADNRGFLRSLENLRQRALVIGETIEADRCDLFLRQLDPDWHGLPE